MQANDEAQAGTAEAPAAPSHADTRIAGAHAHEWQCESATLPEQREWLATLVQRFVSISKKTKALQTHACMRPVPWLAC